MDKVRQEQWRIRRVRKGEGEVLRQIRVALVKENPKTFGVLYSTERKKPVGYFEKDIERCSGSDSGIFFAVMEGKVVGMAKVGRYEKKDSATGYLSSMGILKAYQGKGLGEELLKFRLEWIRKKTSYKKVLMIIVDGNERMTNLARKHGFYRISQGSFYGVPNTKYQLDL